MKNSIFTFLLLIWANNIINAQTAEPNPSQDSEGLGISTLMGYNFNGKGDWSNLTPEIFMGWTENIIGSEASKFNLRLRVGPTFSTIKNSNDTIDYFRSIMLPGNASFSILPYGIWNLNDFKIIMTAGLGAKVLTGINDSTSQIAQSSIRVGLGFQFKKLLSMSVQHTWGNHNLTAESESAYINLFNQPNTNVKYLTVNLQSYMPPIDLYLFVNYRVFLSDFQGAEFANNRIINIGIRKDIDLLGGFQAR